MQGAASLLSSAVPDGFESGRRPSGVPYPGGGAGIAFNNKEDAEDDADAAPAPAPAATVAAGTKFGGNTPSLIELEYNILESALTRL